MKAKAQMVTRAETITPSIAQKYLDTLPEGKDERAHVQRNVRQSLVQNYAQTMVNGHWRLNHQGICFDSEGRLTDGQHRMLAVVRSGVTVAMNVTRYDADIVDGVHIQDTIDRMSTRTVGNQLQMRHGYTHANAVAATASCIGRAIAPHATYTAKMDVGKTCAILDIYQDDIYAVLAVLLRKDGVRIWRRSAIYAALAVCRHVAPASVDEFVTLISAGVDMKKGMPAHALFRWRCNDGMKATTSALVNAVSNAVRKHYLGESMHHLGQNSRAGIDFFLAQQPRNVEKVRKVLGIEL